MIATVFVGYAYPTSSRAEAMGWKDGGHFCEFVAHDGDIITTRCRDKSHACEVAAGYMLAEWQLGRMCKIKNY